MGTVELVELIDKLPVEKQREVETLVVELNKHAEEKEIASETSRKPPMKFGDLKGFVKYISDDFDEPMDDFKDYM